MILTPIPDSDLPESLVGFADSLSNDSFRSVFRRVVAPGDPARAGSETCIKNHSDSIDLIIFFGIGMKPGSPRLDVSWDGTAFRVETEAYVLLHELAHYQLAAPLRRGTTDFGLGPGPETGDRDRAERAALLFGLEREREEAMASLLGILWEAELSQPALASFLDQNWLEGAGKRGAAAHFETTLANLTRGNFVTAEGRPTMVLRQSAD
jgi:hypothetical protein